MRYILRSCVLALVLSLAACGSYGGGSYYGSQTRVTHTVEYGQVTYTSPAQIEEKPTGLGLLGGAVAGGVLGSLFGGGSGHTVGAVVGALAGGAAGYGVERELGKANAMEIGVRLDSGKEIAVIQGLDEQFRVGDRVRVLRASDGSARVRY